MAKKIALVTGAGQGIGLATARALAAEGASVCVCDVDENKGAAAAREIEGLFVKADVAREEEVKRLFDTVARRMGTVDIMVNNAAISPKLPFDQIPAEQFAQVMAVNLQGTFLCCQQAFAQMKEKGWGRIVNLTSMAGLFGANNAGAHYAATKGGVISLTKTLAKSMGPYQITVNCVAPGRINTALTQVLSQEVIEGVRQQIPLRRIAEPEEVASVIAFLASEPAGYVSGACVEVLGGYIA